jgi:hypothetical protein
MLHHHVEGLYVWSSVAETRSNNGFPAYHSSSFIFTIVTELYPVSPFLAGPDFKTVYGLNQVPLKNFG